MPATAFMLVVPDNVGFAPADIVAATVKVELVTKFPAESWTLITGWVARVSPLEVVVGSVVTTSLLAVPKVVGVAEVVTCVRLPLVKVIV